MTVLQESVLRISFLIVFLEVVCPVMALVWKWFCRWIGIDETDEDDRDSSFVAGMLS